jgi:ribosomal protein L24E
MLRLGLAPQVRRCTDGVHREIRREPRQVTWAEIVQMARTQEKVRKEVVR